MTGRLKILNANNWKRAMVRTQKFGFVKVKFVSRKPNCFYRIYRTPRGSFVAKEEMIAPENWIFVSSVRLPEDLSEVDWS